MPIRVACPMCGRTGRVPEHAVGKTIQCPSCGHRRKLTAAAVVPEVIELPAPKTVAGIDELEILDSEPVTHARPASPARARRQPAQRASATPKPAPPPQPEARPLSSMHVVLAFGAGIVAVSIVFLALNHSRTGRATKGPERLVQAGVVAPETLAASPAPATVTPRPEPVVVASPPRVVPDEAPSGARNESPRVPAVLSTAEVVARSEPSVALIKGKAGSGTGFLVAPGVLATNSHVVEDEFISSLEIRFPSADDARKGPLTAELLYEDEKRDLAFLGVRTDLPPLEVAQSYRYRKGEDVTVIGNPGVDGDTVLENAISRGVMSTKAVLEGQQFYQLGIAVNPGNSGGPVFDQSGQVIGVVTLRIPGKEELSFCIPVEELRGAMAKLTGQSPEVVDQTRDRHRILTSFKSLSGAGALYGVALEMHVVLKSNPGDTDLVDTAKKLDTRIQEFKDAVGGTLEIEANRARNDATLPPPTRKQVGELLKSYKQLKEAFERNRSTTPVAAIRFLKSSHRREVVQVGRALDVEVPKALLELLDDHLPTGQAVVASGPFPPGNDPLTRADALRQQMWERHRRFMPGSIPRLPTPPRRFGPTQRFPGRSVPTAPPF